ncbi:MAG: hypothetical protein SGJ20_04305 [Planctomycetota bacterium]|nr:hypothetical protein [Planctomycetota bacterium]
MKRIKAPFLLCFCLLIVFSSSGCNMFGKRKFGQKDEGTPETLNDFFKLERVKP